MSQHSSHPFRLDGRIAVVTGGANGIGSGISAMLADAGAFVGMAPGNWTLIEW